VSWSSQAPGIQIPDETATLLEELWREHIGAVDRTLAEVMADPDAEVFPEGRLLFRLHRLRERNREVVERAKGRAKRKNDGRLLCCVCNFDFAAVYGELGKDFIEGDHTKPLSELAEETETKVTDIALVCSNCHRMLHRRRPWLSIDKLRTLLKNPSLNRQP
jgi:putative restriction endonuclease